MEVAHFDPSRSEKNCSPADDVTGGPTQTSLKPEVARHPRDAPTRTRARLAGRGGLDACRLRSEAHQRPPAGEGVVRANWLEPGRDGPYPCRMRDRFRHLKCRNGPRGPTRGIRPCTRRSSTCSPTRRPGGPVRAHYRPGPGDDQDRPRQPRAQHAPPAPAGTSAGARLTIRRRPPTLAPHHLRNPRATLLPSPNPQPAQNPGRWRFPGAMLPTDPIRSSGPAPNAPAASGAHRAERRGTRWTRTATSTASAVPISIGTQP